jgi:hypothetical protein
MSDGDGSAPQSAFAADIIIENAPDPVFVSDLEGKILEANEAVSQLGEEQRIFGKVYRVDPQQTRGVGGTGLGLYICRELVRHLAGRVSVTSREGQGSTFVVDLPLLPIGPREQVVVSQSA